METAVRTAARRSTSRRSEESGSRDGRSSAGGSPLRCRRLRHAASQPGVAHDNPSPRTGRRLTRRGRLSPQQG
jgi:hypothetical protein